MTFTRVMHTYISMNPNPLKLYATFITVERMNVCVLIVFDVLKNEIKWKSFKWLWQMIVKKTML